MTAPSDLDVVVDALSHEISAANQELSLLLRDRDSTQRRGPPATLRQLEALGRRLSRRGFPPLPSYFAFLRIQNGWEAFAGDAKILSVEDHAADWVRDALAVRGGFEPAASIPDLIPFLLAPVGSPTGFLDPSITDDGEPSVLLIDDRQMAHRLPTFLAFLKRHLAALKYATLCQREGD